MKKLLTIWRPNGLRAVVPFCTLPFLTTIDVTHGVTWFGDPYKCITLTGHDQNGYTSFCLEGMHISSETVDRYYINIYLGDRDDWCDPKNRELFICDSARELVLMMRRLEHDLRLVD